MLKASKVSIYIYIYIYIYILVAVISGFYVYITIVSPLLLPVGQLHYTENSHGQYDEGNV